MAFDLVAAYATTSDDPFFVMGQSPEVLTVAPQQITLRFSPGAEIDPASLAGSIVVQRSGGAGDGFGPAGSKTDVTIVPGSITVDDLPNQNQVVVRFAETPVDDTYRLTINSGLKTRAQGGVPADSFSHAGGPSYSFDFRIDLGSFVVSVVPQPVTRQLSGSLTQARGDIDVYFNAADPLQQTSAETVGFYRLFRVDTTTNADIGPAIGPTNVAYDATTGRARLSFGAALENAAGLYRLEIGGSAAPVPVVFAAGDDNNSSFTTARVLGQLTANGAAINASIEPRSTVTTPVGTLGFPSQPGTLDSPGHRDVPVDGGTHGTPAFAVVDPVSGLAVVPYNFRSVIGKDPQGNDLQNVITEAQKQRAREIFELFSLYSGVRFVETADQGLMVATGDLRAFIPNIPAGSVAGLGGGSGALMNSLINWGNSEYGGSWFRVAMHEIGHALGLGHTYDLPSIMGAELGGEAVFPGDYDIEHLRQLYPANGSDIDVYRFTLAEAGRFSAETVVARPGRPVTSYLDSVISLYREDVVNGRAVRTLVARNDDYYGRDSFVGLDLGAGTYFVAVTSTGNTAVDPVISDSGANGRTEGDYRLDLRFTPASAAANTVVDLSARPIDGDRDGVAGGGFKFWFNAAPQADTIHVDKSSPQAGAGDGSLANPFKTIQAAVAAVQPTTKIIRVAGTAAAPYQIGTNLAGSPLADGATFNVPQGVTVMIDGGSVFKLRAANIDVGSSTQLVSRAGAAAQVLGVPATGAFAGSQVTFTSWHDDSIGGDSDNAGPAPQGGQWGGIVLRQDSDMTSRKAFVNSITGADIRYGGGQVMVDSQLDSFAPVQIESTRPTVLFNAIRNSAGAGIAATPNSFEDTGDRFGPEFRGNRLTDNSINGLFVKIKTEFGTPLDRLDVPARFRSSDIVYVLQENLVISGGAGGYERKVDPSDGNTKVFARSSGRLTIDPGVVVKLQGSRIELERGPSQLIAEGLPGKSVIFTSLGDNRFGGGGTFDTNGNVPDKFDATGQPVGTLTTGDWGGIMLNAGSKASIDRSYIAFGGGETPIEGAFDNFNVVEVHQGELRLANSRIENNAAGTARSSRTGRGGNAASTIFVRGAQPVIVGNDFRSNAGAVISANANALSDVPRSDAGRSTGGIGRFVGYDDNVGPLVRGNRLSYPAGGQAVAGMVVRGGEITVESVWDDTDIVHVLQDEIIVQNFHTATGVRLLSKPNASLVVKLAGPDAGFTAAGEYLDIDDRIGGTVQIVGQPGYPVVLTSLKDDSAGASLDPLGRLVTDTNADGSATSPSAGDWRSLRFLPFSNDRNVAILTERENAYTGAADANGSTTSAESLGVLAPNFATGTNAWESAQEKSGDENRRLGFEVHGTVAFDDTTDVDVYTFLGSAGSEVWIDIDKTSPALDAMVELLDAAGNVLARSVDGIAEGGVVQGELASGAVVGTTATYQFAPAGLLPGQFGLVPGTLRGVIYDDTSALPVPIQTFAVDSNGVITFQNILGRDPMGVPYGATEAATGGTITATGGTIDIANGRLTLNFSGAGVSNSSVEVRYSYQTAALTAVAGIGQTLGKDAWRGGDHFTQNPRDPGMRLILPGTQGVQTRYYLRVRSQPRYEPSVVDTDPNTAGDEVAATTAAQYRTDVSSGSVKNGVTSGRYELRVRLRQRDEKPGSTVRYADIRYPTIGVDVQGLPANSPLVADTGETPADNNGSFATAQYIGNVLESNRGALSVAGNISSAGDVDWYTFALNYEQIQSIGGVNDGPYFWDAVFDIDYADGFRGDLTISVFDSGGTLLYVGRDSDVADDQPGVSQGADFDDLSRGSIGKLDPFIGTVNLTAGGPTGSGGGDTGLPPTPPDPSMQLRYYVAISSNERLPAQLNATFGSSAFGGTAANTLVRLEPIAAVDRVVTDRIGSPMALPSDDAIIDTTDLSVHVTPFTLSDVTLFVTTGTSLVTVDAMRGGVETTVSGAVGANDIVMRSDGQLYGYRGLPGAAGTAGTLDRIDSGTGARTNVGNDGIPNLVTPSTPSATEINLVPQQAGVGSLSTFQLANRDLQAATLVGTLQYTGTVDGAATTGTWNFTSDAGGTLTFVGIAAPAGLARPLSGTVNATTGLVSVIWDIPVAFLGVSLVTTTYTYNVPGDPQSVTTDLVDALAWQRTGVGAYANLFYSVRDGGQSRLYRADPNSGSAAFVQGQPWGRVGAANDAYIQGSVTIGIVTGMAFVGGTLYGVDDRGHFFTIDPATAVASNVRTIAGSPAFAGLAIGPQNLYGGSLANVLFAIDDGGVLRAFDTAGNLRTVFDSNRDGIADATTIATGVGGATGLAFSPLDINLWHTTTRRGGDPGGGETSMYFGLEELDGSQFGGSTPWQQDLLSNPAIGNNYNLPGGAYGSLTTKPFSLAGYAYTDKPTLYFDYWLQTEEAGGGAMRDSARVLISSDGGSTWRLVATNNSNSVELPGFPSVSSRISLDTNQRVQEIFDTANWRQARIDLGEWGGASDLRLRFDFHTAGQFDPSQRDANGNLLNRILGPASTTGNFNSALRGQNNQFEGFYIDDIVIGFAERGESVTGATSGATAFFNIGTPGPDDIVAAQVLTGPYQLEIRRGTERGLLILPDGRIGPEIFDTNDRLIDQRSTTAGYGPKLGDANQPREQGRFIVENNIITSAGQYGIRIDAAARDGGSNSPHPGTPRNLPTLNNQRLAAGAVVTNNIVARAGVAGILFSGDPNTGNVPSAAVPLGRITNNTIYGGLIETRTGSTTSTSAIVTVATTVGLQVGMEVTGPGIPASTSVLSITNDTTLTLSQVATGTGSGVTLTFREPSALATGVSVTENAGPTLLNNLFANLARGVSVDASSAGTSVVGTSAYWNAAGAAGVSESSAIVLTGNPFVNVAGNNFYLAAGSRAIDSSINSLQDRDAFVQVNSQIGISASPIIAPDRDLYGQLRSDDPGVTNMTGFGSNVFKDRGAIDRVDTVQPSAALAVPLDGAAVDLDIDTNQVRLEKADARSITSFELQLNDVGVGIDKPTVVSEAFELRRNGRLLVAGTDYIFNYLEVSNRVVFEAVSVFPMGSYLISVVQTTGGTPVNVVTDLAGNPLLGNQADGTTKFTIDLADAPTVPVGLVGVSGDLQVQLSWAASTSDGDPLIRYELQRAEDSGFTVGVTTTNVLPTNVSLADTAVVNGTPYWYRVRAVNAIGASDWSNEVGPIVPLPIPSFSLAVDTGVSNADGITSNGLINVANVLVGATWEYSVDGGGTWSAPQPQATTTFTLPANALYVAGAVRVRQVVGTSRSGERSNSAAITIDTIAPAAAPITTVTDDAPLFTGPVANGGTTNDPTPILSGTTEAGTIVEIFNGTTTLGTATVTGTGWTFTTATLSDGDYAMKSRATDLAGNVGPDSAVRSFTVDTVPPPAPTITGADDDFGSITGNIPNGGATNDATPTLTGTATAGSTVTVRRGTTTVGTATANGSGVWTLTVPSLADGTYTFTATTTNAAGNTSLPSAGYTITIDTVALPPVIMSVIDDVPVFVGNVSAGVRTNDNTLRIVGTAEPFASVSVRNGTTILGSAVANASGNWEFTTAALADGSVSFTAIANDTVGNTSTASSPAYTVIVDTVAPAAPVITAVIDNVGSITGSVAPGGRTDDTTLRISGTAEPRSRVSVRSGNAVLRTVSADALGNWVVITDPLFVRLHNLNAIARDEAGNTGVASPNHTVTIDQTAPVILSLGSTAASGSYGVDAEIAIFARMSERMRAGSAIDVTLNTGAVVRLSTASQRSELNGTYRVAAGAVATPLSIVSIANVTPIASDIAGNPVASLPAVPVVLAGINVNGALRAFAVGFSSDPAFPTVVTASVTSIPISFSTEVTGVTLADFRLLYADREIVSLSTATISGSGRNYTLNLPANLASRIGTYRLTIGPSLGIRPVVGVGSLSVASDFFWRRA